MAIFNRKEEGRPDLPAINGANKLSQRRPEEFGRRGNGGIDPAKDWGTGEEEIGAGHYGENIGDAENSGGRAFRPDLGTLADDVREPLPKLASMLGKLTYGELLQLAEETILGRIVENFDAMTVGDEAQVLAKRLHVWQASRKSPTV